MFLEKTMILAWNLVFEMKKIYDYTVLTLMESVPYYMPKGFLHNSSIVHCSNVQRKKQFHSKHVF